MIKQLKLTNGEEIIGDVEEIIEDSNDALSIKASFKILQVVNSSGDMNLGFTPWFLFIDDEQEIFLSPSHVIAITKPSDKIINLYNKTKNNDDEEYSLSNDTIGDLIN